MGRHYVCGYPVGQNYAELSSHQYYFGVPEIKNNNFIKNIDITILRLIIYTLAGTILSWTPEVIAQNLKQNKLIYL